MEDSALVLKHNRSLSSVSVYRWYVCISACSSGKMIPCQPIYIVTTWVCAIARECMHWQSRTMRHGPCRAFDGYNTISFVRNGEVSDIIPWRCSKSLCKASLLNTVQ